MHNYACFCTITNRSGSHLVYDKGRTNLEWGEFRDGHEPRKDIPPKSNDVQAFVAQGGVGLAGTEGTVAYRFDDDANVVISIYFNVPTTPGTMNRVAAASSNEDVAANVTGLDGHGSTEAVTVTVVDGRGR